MQFPYSEVFANFPTGKLQQHNPQAKIISGSVIRMKFPCKRPVAKLWANIERAGARAAL